MSKFVFGVLVILLSLSMFNLQVIAQDKTTVQSTEALELDKDVSKKVTSDRANNNPYKQYQKERKKYLKNVKKKKKYERVKRQKQMKIKYLQTRLDDKKQKLERYSPEDNLKGEEE